MNIIGLTGSIGTGKSTTAQMCRHLGLWVHDADATVHQLMAPYGEAVFPILAVFGDVGSVCTGIDRQKLGQIVFSDADKKKQLESILHPLVHADRKLFLSHARRHHQRSVILDVPLLFETQGHLQCDYIISVWASDYLQRVRVLKRPGMTAEKFAAINASQLPQYAKRSAANLALASGLGRAYSFRMLKRWLKRLS